MSNETEKRAYLSGVQVHKLCTYLEAHIERFQATRPTYYQVAAEASQNLGFRVTKQRVAKVIRELGIQWKAVAPSGAGRKTDILAKAVAQIAYEINEIHGEERISTELIETIESLIQPSRAKAAE